MLTRWIQFPNSQEIRTLLARHYELFSLPGVLGFVDGTHINIKKPTAHEEIYVNRKSQHSLNVQIACDSQLKILNILARYPGSSHDSFIWCNSALRSKMQDLNAHGVECWLLGDSGYPSEPWLLTPILNAADGSQEAIYTARHIKARNCVERCIGVLKGRFRCILKHRTLEYDPVKAGKIVNACAVLHNMCLSVHLPINDNMQDSETDEHLTTSAFTAPAELARAIDVRRNVIRRMANIEII
ncbi:putative nuclease HARBI1 [Maniola hyperantus]|uniref:putative nuclease HARBI1 n=1 Tax=Aphantopus hyperantus TaxID=2795564 RepID=UPI003748614D